jgi:hypothetical protein
MRRTNCECKRKDMRGRSYFVVGVSVLVAGAGLLIPLPVMAQEKTSIDTVIKQCVDVVHHFPADQIEKTFFKNFDAFYNPASGQVENNAIVVGDQAALYQFNKCMASHGFPLKYAK